MKHRAVLLIAWLIAAALLFDAAVERHPYSFYTLLRWICCPIFAYSASAAHKRNRMPWVWVFGTLALLYNPLFRVHLDRNTWTIVNWVTIGAIILAAMVFWKNKKSAPSANLAEAITLHDAEKIVHDFASVLSIETPSGEIASYASRLPHSPERIVQAMKLWLAHEIENRSL